MIIIGNLQQKNHLNLLKKLVKQEKDRIFNFKNNPIRSTKELMDSIPLTIKMLNEWDSNYLTDMIERDIYSAKQSALLVRIINSINIL